MKLKALKGISNTLLVYGLIIVGFALWERWDAYRLGGFCPVPILRPWLYSGIAAVVVAMVITFYLDKRKKETKHD